MTVFGKVPGQCPWLGDFGDEVEAFPNGSHDDQVDALSGAFSKLRTAGNTGVFGGEKKESLWRMQ